MFEALKSGRYTMDTEFTVTEDAWRRGGAGGGGSSMFAQVNSRIKLSDLLRGLIVQSGNDAAITIAENMAGSEAAFANLMNQRAKEIGLTRSNFRNATGYSAPDQRVTARDMAKLALHIIETYRNTTRSTPSASSPGTRSSSRTATRFSRSTSAPTG